MIILSVLFAVLLFNAAIYTNSQKPNRRNRRRLIL